MKIIKIITSLLCLCVFHQSALASPDIANSTAKRIIALSPHAVEMLYAIGAGNNIIATTDHADFPESAKKIPRIGGYYGTQIEKVLVLNPDLIVTWSGGNKAEDIQQLKTLGFNMYDSNPTTLTAVANELEHLGELTGHQQQAHKVANQYRQQLAKLITDNQAKAKVSVFYQLWSAPLMTVAKNSWVQQIISVCHGDNIFATAVNDYPQVSLENVLLHNPSVIITSQDKANSASVKWRQWPEINAVKNHQIYPLNADLLHRASPRSVLGVKLMCDTLDKARI